ncbi:hypothetical protein GIB67_014268, partial [Kingdonia uniflora]
MLNAKERGRRDCNSSSSKKIDDEEKDIINLTEEVSSNEALLLSCDDVNESWIVDWGASFHATANVDFLINIVKDDFECKRNTEVVFDHSAGDTVCSECGLVLESHSIDETSEWRTFANEASDNDPNRVGGPSNPLLNEGSLTTVISKANGASGGDNFPRWQNRGSNPERTLVLPFKNIAVGACSNDKVPRNFCLLEELERGEKGYSIRHMHQAKVEKKLETIEDAMKHNRHMEHADQKRIIDIGNVSTAACIATAGTSLVVGYVFPHY